MSSDVFVDPAGIAREIESQLPLMRQEAASAYLGKDVDWFVAYRNAYEISSRRAQLLFAYEASHAPMITGTVALSEYPQLKRLRAGESVRVRGTIRGVDMLQIALDIKELVLPKTVEVAHCPPRQ